MTWFTFYCDTKYRHGTFQKKKNALPVWSAAFLRCARRDKFKQFVSQNGGRTNTAVERRAAQERRLAQEGHHKVHPGQCGALGRRRAPLRFRPAAARDARPHQDGGCCAAASCAAPRARVLLPHGASRRVSFKNNIFYKRVCLNPSLICTVCTFLALCTQMLTLSSFCSFCIFLFFFLPPVPQRAEAARKHQERRQNREERTTDRSLQSSL